MESQGRPRHDLPEDRVGLCVRCKHVVVVRSDRGSLFYQCQRSVYDADYPRYPVLPIRHCRGFDEAKVALPGGKPESP